MSPEIAAQLKARCIEVWNNAKEYYGLHGRKLKIKVAPHRVMGRMAGSARLIKVDGEWVGLVRLNAKAIEQNLADTLEDTIPHEIAHIVCQMDCRYGDGHNAGWKRVCIRLGGNGNNCYTSDQYDLRLRKRKRYIYKVDGETIKVTDVKHNRMQRGEVMRLVRLNKAIHKGHWTGEHIV